MFENSSRHSIEVFGLVTPRPYYQGLAKYIITSFFSAFASQWLSGNLVGRRLSGFNMEKDQLPW